MTRRIPRKLVPHANAVAVEPVIGVSSAGRKYGPRIILTRSQIVDGMGLIGGQYEREADVRGVVYCERSEFVTIPPLDSKVTLWLGDVDEHEAMVKRVEHHKNKAIGDFLVLVLT